MSMGFPSLCPLSWHFCQQHLSGYLGCSIPSFLLLMGAGQAAAWHQHCWYCKPVPCTAEAHLQQIKKSSAGEVRLEQEVMDLA